MKRASAALRAAILAVGAALLSFAALSLLPGAATGTRGAFVALGGGSESPALLRAVLETAGGPSSRVLLLHAASGEPARALAAYAAAFEQLGVSAPVRAVALSPAPKATAYEAIAEADLIYVTGGDQTRLARALADSPLLGALVIAHQRGAVIAGISAGAMAWGTRVLSGQEGEAGYEAGPARFEEPGLALEPELTVDTHFRPEARLGRLLNGARAAASRWAAGVPEHTALVCRPEGFSVLGEGTVWLADLSPPPAAPGASALGSDPPASAGPLPEALTGRLYRLAPGERLGRDPAAAPEVAPWPVLPGAAAWTSAPGTEPPPWPGLAFCPDRTRPGALERLLESERPGLALGPSTRVRLDGTDVSVLAGAPALVWQPLSAGSSGRFRPSLFRLISRP